MGQLLELDCINQKRSSVFSHKLIHDKNKKCIFLIFVLQLQSQWIRRYMVTDNFIVEM